MPQSTARTTPTPRAALPRRALRSALIALAVAATVGCTTGVGGLNYRRPPADIIVGSTDVGAAIRHLSRYLSDEDIAQALVDSKRPASEVSQGLRSSGLITDRLCRVATGYVQRVPEARRAEAQSAVGPHATAACADARAQAPAVAPVAPVMPGVAPYVAPGPAVVTPPSVLPKPYREPSGYDKKRPGKAEKRKGRKGRADASSHRDNRGSRAGKSNTDASVDARRGSDSVKGNGGASSSASGSAAGGGVVIGGGAGAGAGANGSKITPAGTAASGAKGAASAAATPASDAVVVAPVMTVAGLQDGDIKWNVPGNMSAGQTTALELRIKEAAARAKGADGKPSGPSAYNATLEASGIDVRPDAQRQALVEGGDVVWKWVVSPRDAGAQSLTLAIAPVSGDPALGKILIKTVDVAAAPVSMADKVKRFMAEHREKLLLAVIVLLALLAIRGWRAHQANKRTRIEPMEPK